MVLIFCMNIAKPRVKRFTVWPTSKLSVNFLREILQLVFTIKLTSFRHTKYHDCYEYFCEVIIFVIQAFVMKFPIFMTKW